MADEKKLESSSLATALPVTVVAAMLAGLVLTHSQPYKDERPSTPLLQTRYFAAQDVDARLWQDPFAAVDSASEETPTEKVFLIANRKSEKLGLKVAKQTADSSSHTPHQIYNNNKLAFGDKITVLAVTLSGGPYQEDAEERMRRRYAVLSALANRGATPQDEEHIGYFHPDPEPNMGLQKKVAFEWWALANDKSLPDQNRKVLVLWVNESNLLGCPNAKLKELMRQVSQEKQLKGIVFNYAVIGPNTSTLLRDLLKEVKDGKKSYPGTQCPDQPNDIEVEGKPAKINWHDIVYYSAGATASDKDLLKDIEPPAEGNTLPVKIGQGVTLYRTTATDDAMMDVLVYELDKRNVKESDHVVILSEWDTFYGQVMPVAFKNEWRKHYNSQENNSQTMHVYSYMRGLDGKLPEQGDKKDSAVEKKSDSKDKSGAETLIEFPEGQSQKDYLRRLANSIYELDQYIKDVEGNKKGVAAIGVLGSDVHDELMILEALRPYFPHKLFFSTDLDAAYSHPAKWPQTHNLLVASAFDLKLCHELQGKIPPFRDSYQTAFFLAAQIAIGKEQGDGNSLLDPNYTPPPRLFEIGRSHAVPLPTHIDTVSPRPRNNGNALKCAWADLSACIDEPIDILLPHMNESGRPSHANDNTLQHTVQPLIFATSYINWTLGGMMAIVVAAIFLAFVSWWVRERVGQFAIGVFGVLLLAICREWILATYLPQFYWIWGGVGMAAILIYLIRHWLLEKVVQFKLPFYFGIAGGILLLLTYHKTQIWNSYMTRFDAEPFYWLEGVSAWPSQLLRLLAVLFAVGFFMWGHNRIQKMKNDLQIQGEAQTQWTFALPNQAAQLGDCDVLFVGSWKSEANNKQVVFPAVLWKKYLGYCRQKKLHFFPGSWLRVLVHGLAFYYVANLLIAQSGLPNVPVRGVYAGEVHEFIIRKLVTPSIILLMMWVVENARLCERLIFHLSAKPSQWHNEAKDWAIREKKVAPECVMEWLDIQLVVRLTATLQPLIWGPVVCIAMMVLARSPVIDNWDIPCGLAIVLIAMLFYAISAEVLLQKGAKCARAKVIDQLTGKIRAQRNLKCPDEVVIKRIEAEIESIMTLRDGAFRPWYEWPLLRSFGGLGTLMAALQYFEGVWGNGTF